MTNQARGLQFLEDLAEIRKDLPYSPSLLQDLFSSTSADSFATADDIGDTIGRDQGLSARILALANSAFYGLQGRVSSIPRAVALIGFKELRNLVLVLGAHGLCSRHSLPREFDIREHWSHQLSVGIIARLLAEKTAHPAPDLAFTSGLLHDFGKLLTALYRPEDWLAIGELSREMPYNQAEENHWGLEHGLIGSLTLNAWNLPPELHEPVNWHHAPSLAPEFGTEAGIICMANALHHAFQDPEYQYSEEAAQLFDKLGLTPEALLDEITPLLAGEELNQFVSALA